MITVKTTGVNSTIADIKKKFLKQSKVIEKKVRNDLVKNLAAATPVDTGKARDGWETQGKSIVNNVGYIEELNNGSSKQAPSHFIEKTILADRRVKPSGIIVRNK